MPRYVRPDSYLYRLQSHSTYYFEVGRADTRQALWGFLGDTAYVVHFGASGELQRVERRDDFSPPANGVLSEALREMSLLICGDLGLRAEAIAIKRFWLEGEIGGIEDLSEDLKEFIDAPVSFNQEERQELQSALDEWLSSRRYVFWWEQGCEMNSAGEVETS